MHGLINRSIEAFIEDTYGDETWRQIAADVGLSGAGFEAMLNYDDALTEAVIEAACRRIGVGRETLLEDFGATIVSCARSDALRRLLRFGGESFVDFLHSLDDLPERARLAVPDLEVPTLELREYTPTHFALRAWYQLKDVGWFLIGLLRAMGDDYGALVILQHGGVRDGAEWIDIHLAAADFAQGRSFDLASGPVGSAASG